jgi:hypothetical protein
MDGSELDVLGPSAQPPSVHDDRAVSTSRRAAWAMLVVLLVIAFGPSLTATAFAVEPMLLVAAPFALRPSESGRHSLLLRAPDR